MRYQTHNRFIQGHVMRENNLSDLYNFVCGNLLNYTPNYLYWQEQYELVENLNIVINWRKKNASRGKNIRKNS